MSRGRGVRRRRMIAGCDGVRLVRGGKGGSGAWPWAKQADR